MSDESIGKLVCACLFTVAQALAFMRFAHSVRKKQAIDMSGNTQENGFWAKVDKIIEDCCEERVPKCVQNILNCSGYNHSLSLENFSIESLFEIEKIIRKLYHSSIRKFDCTQHGCPTAHYKDQRVFEVLPGHRDLIISMAKHVNQYQEKTLQRIHCSTLRENIESHPGFSQIMKEIIQAEIENHQVPKNDLQYTDIMRYFATLTFNMCGRSCYEVLQKNLPFPSVSTIFK